MEGKFLGILEKSFLISSGPYYVRGQTTMRKLTSKPRYVLCHQLGRRWRGILLLSCIWSFERSTVRSFGTLNWSAGFLDKCLSHRLEIVHAEVDYIVQIMFHFLWDHWAHYGICESGVLLMYTLEGVSSVANHHCLWRVSIKPILPFSNP